MTTRTCAFLSATALLLLALPACVPTLDDDDATSPPADDDDASSPPADDDDTACDATWWISCGDPVCSGWTASGDPLCQAGIQEGDACSPKDSICDPQSGCNELYQCSCDDPYDNENCPISRAKWKKDIAYLDAAGRATLHHELMDMKLATWEYSVDSAPKGRRLGFIIDDQPGIPAVDGDHVDVYAYATMAVAALQEQQKQIDALKAEIEELRKARSCE
jgi:hypothetical protein